MAETSGIGVRPPSLRRLRMPLLAFGLVALVIALLGVEGSPDFYRAASSIIPTLLLTLAVAGRFFLPAPLAGLPRLGRSPIGPASPKRPLSEVPLSELIRDTRQLDELATRITEQWQLGRRYDLYRLTFRPLSFIVLLLLALGEGAALGAVATDTETPVLFALTCASLATGFVAIGFVARGGPVPTGAEPADEG